MAHKKVQTVNKKILNKHRFNLFRSSIQWIKVKILRLKHKNLQKVISFNQNSHKVQKKLSNKNPLRRNLCQKNKLSSLGRTYSTKKKLKASKKDPDEDTHIKTLIT